MNTSLSMESGQAVQILNPKTFEIDTEALKNILKGNSDKPVAVISISGAFRTGKSFLLNFFLRYLRNEGHKEEQWLDDDDIEMTNGFGWKAGSSPHTSGIWIWNKPFVLEDNKGQQIAVFLMDTQGNFSHDSDQKLSTRIFALSTLLSSLQIFNVDKQLQANDLEYLQYFTEISRQSQRPESSAASFQGLLFLVRDWSHQRDFKYGHEGGNQYLEEECTGYPRKSGEKSMREYFSQVFEKLDCFLIPHPGITALYGNNFTGKLTDINEDFIKVVKSLTEHVLHPDNLIKKTVAGEVYTGKKLWLYAKRCHESLKNGPDPKTYMQVFREFLGSEAVTKSINSFNEKMSKVFREFLGSEAVTKSINSFNEKMSKLINSRHRVQGKYRQAFDGIKLEVFTEFNEHSNVGGDYNVRRKYRHKLESEMNGQYEDYKSQFYRKHVDNLKQDLESILSNFKSDVDQCLVSIHPRLKTILNNRDEAHEKLLKLQDGLNDSDFVEESKNLIAETRKEISLHYNGACNKVEEKLNYYSACVMFLLSLYVAPFTTFCLIAILVCLYNLFSTDRSWNIVTVLINVFSIMGKFVLQPARYFLTLFSRQTERPN